MWNLGPKIVESVDFKNGKEINSVCSKLIILTLLLSYCLDFAFKQAGLNPSHPYSGRREKINF